MTDHNTICFQGGSCSISACSIAALPVFFGNKDVQIGACIPEMGHGVNANAVASTKGRGEGIA